MLLVPSILDACVYIVLLIPGKLHFSVISHLLYLGWFISKILVIAMLISKRGPVKPALYFVFSLFVIYGSYCSLVYPVINGSGLSASSLVNLLMAAVGIVMLYLTRKFVVPYGQN